MAETSLSTILLHGLWGWFNDRTSTALAYSKMPLRVWFFTAFMMQSMVSIHELAEALG